MPSPEGSPFIYSFLEKRVSMREKERRVRVGIILKKLTFFLGVAEKAG
jgi:hypothetical protein